MSKLLQDLEKPKTVALQSYTVEHGIEKFRIAVPLSEASMFEEKFQNLQTKTKAAITELVKASGGRILNG